VSADTDVLCIYCQIDFDSREDLVAHIRKEHKDTYAYTNYVIDPWWKR